VHRRDLAISWSVAGADLPFDASAGAPWLFLPPDARRAFDRMARAGVPLVDSRLGRPLLGVKCGCNEAFVSRHDAIADAASCDPARPGPAVVEPELWRPLLRGEGVRAWTPADSRERILWTHAADGRPLRTLPPGARAWLAPWRAALERRSDARAGGAWWSLYRVESAIAGRPRVVWSDVSRGPRACVLRAGDPTVPLNSCYVLPCRDDVDAAALAALLNSPPAAAWLDALAEPARGGFRRYLAWTVARLPVPADWDRARALLAPLGVRGVAGDPPAAGELLTAVARAYRLSERALRPLVEWGWR
jgi:hypothetical protein